MKHVSCSTFLTTILIAAPCAMAYGPTQSQHSSGTTLSQADRTFLMEMAQGNMAEVELGKLAAQKGHSADVRNFGARMENDHTMLNGQLESVAAKLQVTLPKGISAKDEATKSELAKLSGKQFDDAYLKDMLSDHQADIMTVQHLAETSQNSEVKSFADATLPKLEDHLRIAENYAGRLGITPNPGLNRPEALHR